MPLLDIGVYMVRIWGGSKNTPINKIGVFLWGEVGKCSEDCRSERKCSYFDFECAPFVHPLAKN